MKYNAAYYQPVSFTCICCKTLEHIIVSNINKHLAFESILAVSIVSEVRGLAKPNWSTSTMIIDMVSNLVGAQDCGHKQTDVIIMDFTKAFDKVPHRRLLYKLDHYGIRGSTLLYSMLLAV